VSKIKGWMRKAFFAEQMRGQASDTPAPSGVSERQKNAMSCSHRPQPVRRTNPARGVSDLKIGFCEAKNQASRFLCFLINR
jgi:hypothetical protein